MTDLMYSSMLLFGCCFVCLLDLVGFVVPTYWLDPVHLTKGNSVEGSIHSDTLEDKVIGLIVLNRKGHIILLNQVLDPLGFPEKGLDVLR